MLVSVDEFWQQVAPHWERHLLSSSNAAATQQLSMSVLLRLVIWCHWSQASQASQDRMVKADYTE